ncbi:ECF transporter S component [Bifidobacterium mongoliense]|uniref:ECF transporter S component n=1 Tax=Bifidobacterium mongoliense TaxID=518643 RepID=UPI002A76624E|nr:ECF transporter S component [Bifidobacterium mongoliense]MDY3125076.1 ECF transporter S component [Bifidobacterium mongoliense]
MTQTSNPPSDGHMPTNIVEGATADRRPSVGAQAHDALGAWARFGVRDIVFLAISGALVLVCSALTAPLHAIGLFGLPQMCMAPFFAFFMAVGVLKVRKPGSATIIAAVSALLSLMMRPASGIMALLTGLIAELIILAIYRDYRRIAAVYAVSIFTPIAMVPVQVLYYTLVLGRNLSTVMSFNLVVAVVLAMTVVLVVGGSLLGVKVGRELIAHGRLR